jgi:hypothetical protein
VMRRMARRIVVPVAIGLLAAVEVSGCATSRPRRDFSDPVWNVWAERSSVPAFTPENLQRGQDYSIVVNLAALHYRNVARTVQVYSQDVSEGFAKWLEDHDDSAADLEVLIAPDQRSFELLDQPWKMLHLDLATIRATQTFRLRESPFAYLRSHHGMAPFSFAVLIFRVRVSRSAPLGNAPVAFSLWADGKPIDEIAVNLCVAKSSGEECPTSVGSDVYTLRGIDLSGSGAAPDAALHLIERGRDIVGVFRCNSCVDRKYFTWTIGQQRDGWLADRVNELIQRLRPPVPSEGVFVQEGDVLHNLVFPNAQDVSEADRAFSAFVAAAAKRHTEVPPSLFARVLANKPTLILFPLALMRVPLGDGTRSFVGFDVNIESPLELQDYSVQSRCISEWVLFAPPAGRYQGDVEDARVYANAAGWIDSITKECPGCVYSDPHVFADWLLGNTQSSQPMASQAIVALSQYGANSLFFDGTADNPPAVPSASIRRTFAPPSFAILDACGTAAPGGSEFVRSLNEHGVYSIISTSAAIPGAMGGQFLKTFVDVLKGHPTYTVSRARYEAVKLLRIEKSSTGRVYGPQALEFVLVGNGGLRVCLPGAKAKQAP